METKKCSKIPYKSQNVFLPTVLTVFEPFFSLIIGKISIGLAHCVHPSDTTTCVEQFSAFSFISHS